MPPIIFDTTENAPAEDALKNDGVKKIASVQEKNIRDIQCG